MGDGVQPCAMRSRCGPRTAGPSRPAPAARIPNPAPRLPRRADDLAFLISGAGRWRHGASPRKAACRARRPGCRSRPSPATSSNAEVEGVGQAHGDDRPAAEVTRGIRPADEDQSLGLDVAEPARPPSRWWPRSRAAENHGALVVRRRRVVFRRGRLCGNVIRPRMRIDAALRLRDVARTRTQESVTKLIMARPRDRTVRFHRINEQLPGPGGGVQNPVSAKATHPSPRPFIAPATSARAWTRAM